MIRILPRAHVLIALLTSAFPAAAQDYAASPTTRLIPYSATLPDAGPDAMAGARSITFALFDEAEGGTRLWTETQTVNVDARGRYAAHLGASTPLPLDIFRTEQARWLEVTVDDKALPRTMLVAVPYALRAADAETLGGKPLSEFVLTDGSGRRVRADSTTIDDPAVDGTGIPGQLAKWNGATTLSSSIISESFDNRIGILAPDPTGGGVVDARFTIRHLDNNTALAVLNTSNQRRFALNTTSTGGFQFFDGAGGNWNAGMIQQNGQLTVGPPVGFPNTAKLRAFATPAERNAVLARKSGADLFSRAIAARSGAGVAGPLITAFVGIDDNTDFGGPNAAVWAENFTPGGIGVMALASAAGAVGIQASGPTLAGQFFGNVSVSGTLTKGGGAFEIDHPLDPATKYLRHSFVESPDMMNVYNGNVTLDAKGEAWVTLPEWFEALNRDFRYQLTAVGAPGPNLYVASKVSGNRFKIAGGVPDAEVSWQVTGIRQDAWANKHRIQVEENKKGDDAGRYLHPDAYGLGSEMAVPSARPNAGVVMRKEIR